MTLATHILVAGALVKPLAGSIPTSLLFATALASHYLSDAIPHYDYKLISKDRSAPDNPKLKKDWRLITIDLARIFLDIAIGAAILYYLFPSLPFFWVVTGAILPDALQPLFWLYKKFPIKQTQAFHDFMHAELRLDFTAMAIFSQLALAASSIAILAI